MSILQRIKRKRTANRARWDAAELAITFRTAPYSADEYTRLKDAFGRAGRRGIDIEAAWRQWWPLIRTAATDIEVSRRMAETAVWDSRAALIRILNRMKDGETVAGALGEWVVRQALMYGGGITDEDLDKASSVELAAYAANFLNSDLMKDSGGKGRPGFDKGEEHLVAVLATAFAAVGGRRAGTSSRLDDSRGGPAVELIQAGLLPFREVGGIRIRDMLRKINRRNLPLLPRQN